MIHTDNRIENGKYYSTNNDKTLSKQSKKILLFEESSTMPVGDEVVLSGEKVFQKTITPAPDGNDTIPPVPMTDTLRFFKDPKDMVVVEFYPSGKPHYVKDFYDNVITKQTEYAGDGTPVAIDEYIGGKLRRHTENYLGSGEPWTIEEYSENGNLIRFYEYAPFGRLIDYQAFPDE